MSDHIAIDFDRVAQAATNVEAAAVAIRGVLDQMDATLAVVETQWEGDAFVAYRAMRQRWETQMRTMQATLSGYAGVLRETNTALQTTEAKLAAAL